MAIRTTNYLNHFAFSKTCQRRTKQPVGRIRLPVIKKCSPSFVKSPQLPQNGHHREDPRLHSTSRDSSSTNPLNSLRQQLKHLPFKWHEVLPMCSLFFCMAFINTIINSLSLSMVVTAPGGGAVVIPYLTVYAVLPASVVFTVVYAYAAHHVSRDRLFNLVILSFAAILGVFAFVIYPHHQSLHLNKMADVLTGILPCGFEGGIGMIRNWTFTLFYCLSELWGDVGLSLLFWGFANDITHVDHAPLLYPLFGLGANVAQTIGGLMLKYSSSSCFSQTFKSLTIQMLVCSAVILALHHWIAQKEARKKQDAKLQAQWKALQRINMSNGKPENASNGHVMLISWREDQDRAEKVEAHQKKKNRKSFQESLKVLMQCPQIRCLGIMTIAQGLAVTLMEFLWKCHLKIAYPTPEAFTAFLGDISTATGIVTGVLMLVSPILFSRLRWGKVANLTPDILHFGGLIFFGACLTFHLAPKLGFSALGQTMMLPIIFGGACLFVLARGAKFSLFKPAEEMVYITLDDASRTKGKAAVDVVGAQIGKSGGSILQQVLLMLSGGKLLSITPIMVAFYFYMLQTWKAAVSEIDDWRFLSKQTKNLKSNAKLTDEIHFAVPLP